MYNKNRDLFKNGLKLENYVTSGYSYYKSNSKLTFNLLNSIKGPNIYRVYPHKIFCNTVIQNKCVTHDEEKIFYRDGSHPSSAGAEMINNLILSKIKEIEIDIKK